MKNKFFDETSKVILWVILAISYIILLAIIIIGWFILNRNEIAPVCVVVMAPVATVVTCYAIKARSENLLKIRKSIIEQNKIHATLDESNTEFIKAVDEQINGFIAQETTEILTVVDDSLLDNVDTSNLSQEDTDIE